MTERWKGIREIHEELEGSGSKAYRPTFLVRALSAIAAIVAVAATVVQFRNKPEIRNMEEGSVE